MRYLLVLSAVVSLIAIPPISSAKPAKFVPSLGVSWSDGSLWEDTMFDEELFTWDEEGIPEIRVRTNSRTRGLAVLEYQDDDGRWRREDSSRVRRGRAVLQINPWCEVNTATTGTPHTDGSPAMSETWAWCSGDWVYRVRIGRSASPSIIIAFVPNFSDYPIEPSGGRPDITNLP